MNHKQLEPIIKTCVLIYLVSVGLLIMLTGLLHFVYNSPESFEINGFKTNPTFAVFLVAIVLLVCGFTTIIICGLPIFQKRKLEKLVTQNCLFLSVWFLILACLSFFMTGIMGLITSIFCFFNTCGFVVSSIWLKMFKKKDVLMEKDDDNL